MVEHIATLNFNRINDHSLGDLDSPLWAKMDLGYDRVRDDLVRYYQECTAEVIVGKHADHAPVYDAERSTFPNNCFSYATGMISTGNRTLAPYYLSILDFSDPSEQKISVSSDEIEKLNRVYDNGADFIRRVSSPLMMPLERVAGKDLHKYRPVIGLYAGCAYHFIHVDVAHDGQSPVVAFREKSSGKAAIVAPQSLKSFQKNYTRSLNAECGDPVLFAASDELVGRRFDAARVDGGYAMTLKAKLKLKQSCGI